MVWDGESAQRLLNGTSGMFNSRLYSDLEVLYKDGATYYVHKYIEAQENVIDLSNDDPALVKAVLRFFYYHDYEPTTNTEPMLLFHTKMYVMGAYYFIPGLKEHAKKKLRSLILDGSWETKEFPDAIAEIYDWTVESDKGLRDVVVRATTDNFDTLKTDQHFLDVA
ncbi:putative btb poz domain-containing protein [Neofusicoccum parvum UCRNP2]|uniref:Putative btb poz domain-containing protein n=1 Tax=Botryosphaeria parva (strain UCR-NP2) TaxID=1287680 RepID=R1E7X1_BOTPV|nr:putative btb poz domain-containing protein [Neofusicoccum parvum UCRNP2]